jgi:hypothetical protein
MKLVTVTAKKLNLSLETLRLLKTADLQSIAGGRPPRTDLCTVGPCGGSRAGCF